MWFFYLFKLIMNNFFEFLSYVILIVVIKYKVLILFCNCC